jgi:hypothetical protein
MRRSALALTLLLSATTAFAHDHFPEDCSGTSFRFDDQRGFAKKEVIQAGNLASLRLDVENAPVRVRGGNSAGYTITVCKGAELQSELDQIKVWVEGGEVKTSGPSGSRWSVLYQLDVPDRANLEVTTGNGPLSIADVDGKVDAQAENGPLTLKNLHGDIEAVTTNGPVSISGGSGTMKVRATNGPVTVHLEGNAWSGSLDVSTKNGPLTLRVPENYGSGVVVEASGRSPVNCASADCRGLRPFDPTDDQPRRIELGNGPQTIHLSTVNGPVSVKTE